MIADEQKTARTPLTNRLVFWLGLTLLFAIASEVIATALILGWPIVVFRHFALLNGVVTACSSLWLATVLSAPPFIRWRALWLVALSLLLLPVPTFVILALCKAGSHHCA